MSLKRRLLRQGGVDRKVKRMVLTFTTSTYTLQKGADGKPKQDAHINLDAPGWTDVEVLAVLSRAVADVEEKVAVDSDAKRHEGLRMLDGINVMAPGGVKIIGAQKPINAIRKAHHLLQDIPDQLKMYENSGHALGDEAGWPPPPEQAHKGVNDGASTLPSVRPTDPAPEVAGAARDDHVCNVLASQGVQ